MSPRRTRLHIADDFHLPIEVLTEAIGILATRGAGKTYTAKLIAEEALKMNYPVVILDPMGAWWGLRSPANPPIRGAPQGYPIAIFGGEHGDLPLEPGAGKFMADLVAGERLSAIFDVKLWSKTKRREFVADFAERLLHVNRDPIFVMLEEAHRFAPQTTREKADARMKGAVTDLATEGRGNGIGVGMISQRSARVDKDLLEEVDNLIILRTQGPNDRQAIMRWIKTHEIDEYVDEVMASLPRLATGTGWVWAPALLGDPVYVEFREAETFDSSATPRPGQRRRRPKTVAELDLDSLAEQIDEIREMKEQAEANDPVRLQRKIKQLEKQLSSRPDVDNKPQEVEVPVLDKKLVQKLEGYLRNFQTAGSQLVSVAESVTEASRDVTSALAAAKGNVAALQHDLKRGGGAPAAKPIPTRKQARSETRRMPTSSPVSSDVPKAAIKLLGVIAQLETCNRAQAGLLAGYSLKSSHIDNMLSKLRTAGYIAGSADSLSATQEGIDFLGDSLVPLPTGLNLLEFWCDKLPGAAAMILRIVVDHYPSTLTRDEIGMEAELSLQSSHIDNMLSRLRTMKLITGRSSAIKAADDFMGLIEVGA